MNDNKNSNRELKRDLRTRDVIMIAFGAMIGWGWVVSSGQWIETGGAIGTAIGFIIGGIMIYFVGLTYAELTTAMPKSGGALNFSHAAFGPFGSFICSWTLALSYTSNPQPIGFSGILLAKRQNSFYCTYFLHNRNVADTKSPYPIKRLEVIRWFNQKSMVFNQSLS